MAQAILIKDVGGRDWTREELAEIHTPEATTTWHPVAHSTFVDRVLENLSGSGFLVSESRFTVSAGGSRLFATLDLQNRVSEGVVLCVGLRNSHDKTFPLGFCAGERVMVCSNLSFGAELIVNRKHTRFGEVRFNEAIAGAIERLREYQEATAERFSVYRNLPLTPVEADACILRAFKGGVLNTRTLPVAIREWDEPALDEFRPRTGWSLFNALTVAMREQFETNPAAAAYRSIRLRAILEGKADESTIEANAEPH